MSLTTSFLHAIFATVRHNVLRKQDFVTSSWMRVKVKRRSFNSWLLRMISAKTLWQSDGRTIMSEKLAYSINRKKLFWNVYVYAKKRMNGFKWKTISLTDKKKWQISLVNTNLQSLVCPQSSLYVPSSSFPGVCSSWCSWGRVSWLDLGFLCCCIYSSSYRSIMKVLIN